jgi:hypothetical protein
MCAFVHAYTFVCARVCVCLCDGSSSRPRIYVFVFIDRAQLLSTGGLEVSVYDIEPGKVLLTLQV